MSDQTRGIAVFGSSDPVDGDPLYEQARLLGRLLAQAGHCVVSGAYGGVMEAASRGANEAGGRTLGVACEIFSARSPNEYLSEVVLTPDLFIRTRELVDRSRGFVVLDGKAGTLAELSFLWALRRAGCLGPRPVVLLGRRWNGLLRHLEAEGMLEPSQLESSPVVDTPETAVALLGRVLETS